MEYSLYTLNKKTNLKNLNSNELINTLNLIGFEVDGIETVKISTTNFLEDKKLVLKIPANREDLLNEKLLLKDFSVLFLFEVYETWQILKKKYTFLIDQVYQNSSCLNHFKIKSNDLNSLVYKIDFKISTSKKSPVWLKTKLTNHGFNSTTIVNDILNLVLIEFGSNFGCSVSKDSSQIDHTPLEFEILQDSQTIKTKYKENLILKSGTCILKDKNNQVNTIIADLNVLIENENLKNHFNSPELKTSETVMSLNFIFNPTFENKDVNEPRNLKLVLPFLRKSFTQNVSESIQRILTLLEITASASILNVFSTKNDNLKVSQFKILELNKNYLCKTLNLNTYDPQIFEKAGLKVVAETNNFLYFDVPTSRKDLDREIDLIEEYSRFIGYKNFKEILPIKNVVTTKKQLKNYEFIQNFFIDAGFNEVFTNSIHENKQQKNQILLTNPLNQEFFGLRTSNLPALIKIFGMNFKLGTSNLGIFEIGRVFKRVNQNIIEQDKLTGIFEFKFLRPLDQNDSNWLIVKGFFENFLTFFGYQDATFEILEPTNKYFHPTRSILIKMGNKVLGSFGEINPRLIDFEGFKSPIFIFDFNLNHFKSFRLTSEIKIAKDYSKYPSIFKDISFLIDKSQNFNFLKSAIQNVTTNLRTLEFFDVYQDTVFSKEKINVGVRLEFQSQTETLTTEFIETEISKLKSELRKISSINFRE